MKNNHIFQNTKMLMRMVVVFYSFANPFNEINRRQLYSHVVLPSICYDVVLITVYKEKLASHRCVLATEVFH